MSLAPGRRPNRNNAQDRETVGYGNWLSECYRRLFSVAGGRVLSMLCGGLEFGSKASKQAMVSIQQAGRQAGRQCAELPSTHGGDGSNPPFGTTSSGR